MSRLCTSLVWSCFLLGVLDYDIHVEKKKNFATNCTVKKFCNEKLGYFAYIEVLLFLEYLKNTGIKGHIGLFDPSSRMGFTACDNIDSTGTKGS